MPHGIELDANDSLNQTTPQNQTIAILSSLDAHIIKKNKEEPYFFLFKPKYKLKFQWEKRKEQRS